ncbi:hypothetical protein EC957_001505 [Mortierella hygrophila]|uniref:Uncharacterized protein n=1 Tax=Mortierella hygrophila TaxID=979708 RepID=A0A9P6K282_9FUNG|nr:hypothetical protein EC957_001505 [Mortierella hygrophila]
MAKQDAIIDCPHQIEKESATNGFCKDKQLQLQLKPQQDAVDVASLAIVDLDPTSVQTLDNSEDTEANDGLARWHSWVNQQAKNGIVGNASDLTSWRDGTLEITPTSLIQYLEAVVLPLERASSLSTADTSTTANTATFSVTSRKGATSVIETYLKPVLQLWQHQYQHKEGQLRQEQEQQRQSRRYPDPTSSSSSVTLSSESKSFQESLSDDRAVVLSVQQAIRQQDQIQRLIHLEKSHQDTALVISQLQDRVQRLVDDCAHQKRLQLHSYQEKDQNMLRACDNESESNGIVGLATLIGRRTVHRGYSPSTRRHHQGQQRQQQQTNGYYGGRGETHRADELIEVIAKGLEEYHARAAYERARQRSGTDPSTTGHDHSSWRHIDLTGDNASGPLHPPQSPHDSAVDYHHHYEIETSDRSLGPHQRQSTSYYEDQSPTQLHHNNHHRGQDNILYLPRMLISTLASNRYIHPLSASSTFKLKVTKRWITILHTLFKTMASTTHPPKFAVLTLLPMAKTTTVLTQNTLSNPCATIHIQARAIPI